MNTIFSDIKSFDHLLRLGEVMPEFEGLKHQKGLRQNLRGGGREW